MGLTFVDFTEGSATELFDNSVAFLQNFLAFLEHDFNYDWLYISEDTRIIQQARERQNL